MILSLEGIRGFAALIVALYHLKIGTEYFSVIRNGYIFVDLFFVLSGFVICAAYYSKINSTQDLGTFIIRRFGRLFPLLVFSTIVYLLLANLIVLAKQIAVASGYAGILNNPGDLQYIIPSVAEILTTLTMTHSLGMFDRLILNTPSWSISTEFYTYLLFAFLCLALPAKSRVPAFFAMMLSGLGVTVWASVDVHRCLEQGGCMGVTYDYGFMRCVYSFFLGALTYYACQSLRINYKLSQIAGIAVIGIGFALIDQHPVVAFLFPWAFALLIIGVSGDQGSIAHLFKCRPFQILGQRSYSIYMLHVPLVLIFENFAKRVDGFIPSLIVVVAYLGTLLVISGWSYRFIEDPFRHKFNRIANRSKRFEHSAPLAIKPSAE